MHNISNKVFINVIADVKTLLINEFGQVCLCSGQKIVRFGGCPITQTELSKDQKITSSFIAQLAKPQLFLSKGFVKFANKSMSANVTKRGSMTVEIYSVK